MSKDSFAKSIDHFIGQKVLKIDFPSQRVNNSRDALSLGVISGYHAPLITSSRGHYILLEDTVMELKPNRCKWELGVSKSLSVPTSVLSANNNSILTGLGINNTFSNGHPLYFPKDGDSKITRIVLGRGNKPQQNPTTTFYLGDKNVSNVLRYYQEREITRVLPVEGLEF